MTVTLRMGLELPVLAVGPADPSRLLVIHRLPVIGSAQLRTGYSRHRYASLSTFVPMPLMQVSGGASGGRVSQAARQVPQELGLPHEPLIGGDAIPAAVGVDFIQTRR
jgi:hypothetical protein